MANFHLDAPTTEYYDHKTPSHELEALINELEDTPEVAIDTETTGLVLWKDKPLYWSLAWGRRRMTLNVSVMSHFKKRVLNDASKRWILANAKYDQHILANVGCQLKGKLIDISVQHALLYEEKPHGLKDICQHLFQWRWNDFQDTFGKINAKQTAHQLILKAEQQNMALLAEYAANDAWGTYSAYGALQKQLRGATTHSLFRDIHPFIETLDDYFEKLEVPYTKVLWKYERNGIRVNVPYLESIRPQAEQEIDLLERAITKEAGYLINPNSTAQISDYFISKLKVKPLKMTKGGKTGVRKPSVNVEFLDHYAATIPMAAMLLRHRGLKKLHGTYITGLQDLCDPNGKLHTRFNQDVARTGRLSSSGPNLQNIPKADKDKWKLRGAFIPDDGYVLTVWDYEQLEMRLLAAASRDPGMCAVIHAGKDIHMGNAELIFGKPYDDYKNAKKTKGAVDKGELDMSAINDYILECLAERDAVKTIGFGIIYGMGPAKMAVALKISKEEAEDKIEQFNISLPAVAAFTEESILETEATGYAFTIMGRRRNVPEILSANMQERSKGERIAKNTPIQGSAADVVKMAQILIDQSGIEERTGFMPMLQVHDEIVGQTPIETSAAVLAEVQQWMEHPFIIDLDVPLAASAGSGANWLVAK